LFEIIRSTISDIMHPAISPLGRRVTLASETIVFVLDLIGRSSVGEQYGAKASNTKLHFIT
jgi:hypothetical protein